jgi:hypothetical protein
MITPNEARNFAYNYQPQAPVELMERIYAAIEIASKQGRMSLEISVTDNQEKRRSCELELRKQGFSSISPSDTIATIHVNWG